jgi:type III restriction enzyme
MNDAFFQTPILNSPYHAPANHWELDGSGQPTSVVLPRRRQSALVSPIRKAEKVRGKAVQADFLVDEQGQEYNPTEVINGIRSALDSWRSASFRDWNSARSRMNNKICG